LKDYTVKEIAKGGAAIDNDPKLTKAAENFNSPKYQNKVVVGSGPYKFDKWQPNQRVVLKKKENWWGDALKNENHWFAANSDEIVYEIVNDATTRLIASSTHTRPRNFCIPTLV